MNRMKQLAVLGFLLFTIVLPVRGQDADVDPIAAITARMYYSEGVPLDGCTTATCDAWRAEIRVMLEQGKSKEDIIYEFVHRFGYRVLGVAADDVNTIARKLYCPVCEGIPLVECGTAACQDWRNEIGIYLAEGMTEQEVMDDFVARFGDSVVGTPRDPFLRALSLVTPWILVGAMLFFAVRTFLGWRKEGIPVAEPAVDVPKKAATPDDDYLARLEQDLTE